MAKATDKSKPIEDPELEETTAPKEEQVVEPKENKHIARIKKMDKPALISELKTMNIKDIETFPVAKLRKTLLEALVASKEIQEPKRALTDVPGTTKKVVSKDELKVIQQEGRLVGFDPLSRIAIIKKK